MAAIDDILTGEPGGMRRKPVPVVKQVVNDGMQHGAPAGGVQPVTAGGAGSSPVATADNRETAKPGTDGRKRMEERQGYGNRASGTGGYTVTGINGKPVDITGGDTPRRMSYVELYEAMNRDKPEGAEERARRETREKSEAILSAVGDGISALSNLFFTSRYAPNAYDPSKGMSAKARERWDRLRKEREARRREYNEGYMRASMLDRDAERDDRNWRHILERERIADERYEVKAAQDKAIAELDEQLRRHQITAAEYKAEQERIAAQFAEGTEMLKQENLRAGVRQKDAAAGASKASASASYSRARYYDNGGGSGKVKHHFLGKEYASDKDYVKDVTEAARAYNLRHGKWEKDASGKDVFRYEEGFHPVETERHISGKGDEARKPEEFAGEVERRLEEEKKEADEFAEYEVDDDFSQYEKK